MSSFDKMTSVGFSGPKVRERRPFRLQDAARYPLFPPELVELMGELLTPEQQAEVAVAITVTAIKR